MYPRYSRERSIASLMRRPSSPLTSTLGTSGISFITCGYVSTVPPAEHTSNAIPMRNRHRVSSHDLYQSMSVLHRNACEKDVLQRDRHDVDRHGTERARFVEDRLGARARQNREHPPVATHALDARRAERRLGCIALEHELNAPVVLPHVVERRVDDGAAAIDDGHA